MKCSAITRDGTACKATPLPASAYCYNHSPEKADERHRNASLGGRLAGRGRPLGSRVDADAPRSPISAELTRLQGVFERLADDVLEGNVDRSAAAVAIQALNGARGCVVGALKAQEQEELVAEFQELKATLEEGGTRWRA